MKSKKNILILMIVIVISLFGITYAFFDYYKLGGSQEIISGKVSLNLTEGTDTISVLNFFPETKENARSRTDNTLTFTITGHNTTLDNDIYYEIMLNNGDEKDGMTRFNSYDLCFDLVEIDSSGNRIYIFEQMSFEDFDARRIWVDTIDRETEIDISRTYELRMWLSEDVIISDTNPNSDYPATGYENYYASVRVSVFGDFVEKEINSNPNYLARVDADMQFWPTDIMNYISLVSEVKFVAMGETEMETRYNSASIKADVTASSESIVQGTSVRQLSFKAKSMENTKGGKVYTWLEDDANNEEMYIMYVVSDGLTYFPSDSSMMFFGFVNTTSFIFENINTSEVTDMGGMFYYCASVSSLNLKKFDTSNVINFVKGMIGPDSSEIKMGMFENCSMLSKINMTGWDTSKATNMARMFAYCENLLELEVNHFNTGNVVDMSLMFSGCYSLTSLNLNNWDTSNVINMCEMFSFCRSILSINLKEWDTSKVSDMSFMFYECNKLQMLDVSNFNTGDVINMASMFSGCESLSSLNVSKWDTSKVTDIGSIFASSSDTGVAMIIKNLDVSKWDTSNVTNMFSVFAGCANLVNLDVSNWDTSKVTNTSGMFSGCSSLVSLSLNKWDTSKVTDMTMMFSDCSNLVSLSLDNWNTSQVTNMSSTFEGCSNLTELNLASFNTSLVTNMNKMFDGCSNLRNLNITNFTFGNVEDSIAFIFRGMPDDTIVTVGSTSIQTYILALDTSNNRPASWATENVVVAS